MATDVMATAAGQWPRLLIELAGLAPEQLENRHQPCPACGGTDRYRWDRDDGPGGWFCNQCGGRDQRGGGGSGMDLLLRLTGWDFATAARRIEAHLALPAEPGQHRPAPASPCRVGNPRRGQLESPSHSRSGSKAGRPARIPGTPPPDAPPPELGRASGQWCYTDAAGAPLFWVQRLDLLQGGRQRKVFVQRTWLDGGWHFPSRRDPFRSDWPAPRPLYRLAELERHFWAPVLITEGEKAADAAVALFPDHVVVSWCGGSQAIASVDWSPLAGRAVSLWPDADASGREAMARLSALLLELGCHVAVVLPPSCTEEDWDLVDAPGASGWDLADATWSAAEAQSYLEGHSRTVQLPEPEADDDHDLQTANGSTTVRPPAGQRSAANSPGGGEPFVCLGYDSDGYFYQPRSTGQVVRLGSSAHGGVNLCRLAPLAYWETLYPNKRGVNWTAAASDLFCRQATIGMFDPDLLRGRGIWWDEGRCVLHLGDRLVVLTRWDHQDVIGWLYEQELGEAPQHWTVLDLPAIAEEPTERAKLPPTCTLIPDWRQPGEALCPERFPLPELLKIRARLGAYGWAALYQQRPSPASGSIFLRQWIRPPFPREEGSQRQYALLALSCDLSFKGEAESDYCGFCLAGLLAPPARSAIPRSGESQGQMAPAALEIEVLWAARHRFGLPEVIRFLLCCLEALEQQGLRPNAVLIEDAANGPAVLQTLRRRVPGMLPITARGSKETRAHAVAPLVEAGQIRFHHRAQPLVEEAIRFPKGSKDLVDAFCHVALWLEGRYWKAQGIQPVVTPLLVSR